MKKVLFIIGTRPEAIKLAPLIQVMHPEKQRFETVICHSGQHTEQVREIFRLFDLQADVVLDPPHPRSLAGLYAWLLEHLDRVLQAMCPDLVIVQGDTTTALAGAHAAFYHQIPVAHVEAGLRTSRPDAPFPEEANRRLISRLATYHFPPTALAAEHLIAEGIPSENMVITGNTVIDALAWVIQRNKVCPGPAIEKLQKLITPVLKGVGFGLVTLHRRENHGQRLQVFCRQLSDIQQRAGIHLVFCLHPNPVIRPLIESALKDNPAIHLLPPQAYDAFVYLLQQSYLIITDSGGIQEEATALGKPVILCRSETERPEGVVAGNIRSVGIGSDALDQEVERLLKDQDYYRERSKTSTVFGDGKAGERIVRFLSVKTQH